MKSSRIISIVLTAVLTTTMLAGCGQKTSTSSSGSTTSTTAADTSKPVTLKFVLWDYSKAPEFKEIIDGFQKENPNITIDPTDIPATGYGDKLTVMIAGGEQADLIALKDMPSYSNYAKNKQLVALDDYIAKDKIDLKNYNGITDSIKLDSKLYGLPYLSDFWLMYYNKDIFDKAKVAYPASDMTWKQYSELTKKMTSGSGNDQVYGGYTHTWKSAVMDFAVADKKGKLTDGKYEFLKSAYDVFLPMQNQDKSVMPLGTAKAASASYTGQFETGKAATVLMGTWLISTLITDKAAGKHNVNWGIVPVPHFEDGKAGDTFGNVTPIGINANSKDKDAAWKFVKYIGTDKGAKILANRGRMPAYRDAAIMDTFGSIAGFPTDSKKSLATTNVELEFPPSKNGAAIDKILQEEHELIMIGKNTVDQGIANMNKRVQDEINSNK